MNGVNAEVVNYLWKGKVSIKPGINTLTIVAVDKDGNSNTIIEKVSVYERTIIMMTIDNCSWTKNGEVMKPLDCPAKIIAGRTVLPLRAIAEGLGGSVEWDSVSMAIHIILGQDVISMIINDPTAFINGRNVELDFPPTIVEGRTLIPLRFASEGFGCEIDWDVVTSTITLTRTILPE